VIIYCPNTIWGSFARDWPWHIGVHSKNQVFRHRGVKLISTSSICDLYSVHTLRGFSLKFSVYSPFDFKLFSFRKKSCCPFNFLLSMLACWEILVIVFCDYYLLKLVFIKLRKNIKEFTVCFGVRGCHRVSFMPYESLWELMVLSDYLVNNIFNKQNSKRVSIFYYNLLILNFCLVLSYNPNPSMHVVFIPGKI